MINLKKMLVLLLIVALSCSGFGAGAVIATENQDGTSVSTIAEENNENKDSNSPTELLASLSKDGSAITISGTTNSLNENELSLYVEDPMGKIAYVDQTTADTEGNFTFTFPLKNKILSGIYKASVAGTDIIEPKTIAFDYYASDDSSSETPGEIYDPNEGIVEIVPRNLFLDGNINITFSSSETNITGSLRCINSVVSIKLINITDNTVIIDETISRYSNPYTFNYALPSHWSKKKYSLSIGSRGYKGMQFILDAEFNTLLSSYFVKLNGGIELADNVIICGERDTKDSLLPFKSVVIEDNKTVSATYPVIYGVSAFSFDIKGYESCPDFMVTEVNSDINNNLYKALKSARPELDEDNDGVISRSELQSIKGILDLSNSDIESVAGLSQCTNIIGLIISGNKINSLRPLSELYNLEYIDARNNLITNISTMPANLKYLNLDYNLLEGLEGLKVADKLVYLSASHNKISTLLGIGDKNSLRFLKLNDNTITDISSLSGCTSIVHADLRNNNVSVSTPLDSLAYIRYFNLGKNNK